MPEKWKRGLVIFLYKSKNRAETNNYRPITLLNSIYKIWTVLVSKRLSMVTELLTDERQLGFKEKRGTIEAVQVAQAQILKQVERFNIKKKRKKSNYLDGSEIRMGPNNKPSAGELEEVQAPLRGRGGNKEERKNKIYNLNKRDGEGGETRQGEGEVEDLKYEDMRGEEEAVAIFFDLSKAFDKINREGLYGELSRKGMDKKWTDMIRES